MSKKKDPNEVLMNKRLREVDTFEKRELKRVAPLKNEEITGLVTENYRVMRQVISLEHKLWNVSVERVGEDVDVITLDPPTKFMESLPKKEQTIMTRMHKGLSMYEANLEKHIEFLIEKAKTAANEAGAKEAK